MRHQCHSQKSHCLSHSTRVAPYPLRAPWMYQVFGQTLMSTGYINLSSITVLATWPKARQARRKWLLPAIRLEVGWLRTSHQVSSLPTGAAYATLIGRSKHCCRYSTDDGFIQAHAAARNNSKRLLATPALLFVAGSGPPPDSSNTLSRYSTPIASSVQPQVRTSFSRSLPDSSVWLMTGVQGRAVLSTFM